MLSLQLRYQYHHRDRRPRLQRDQDYKTANYAFAAFAKATWKLGDDEGSFHPFFSLAAAAATSATW